MGLQQEWPDVSQNVLQVYSMADVDEDYAFRTLPMGQSFLDAGMGPLACSGSAKEQGTLSDEPSQRGLNAVHLATPFRELATLRAQWSPLHTHPESEQLSRMFSSTLLGNVSPMNRPEFTGLGPLPQIRIDSPDPVPRTPNSGTNAGLPGSQITPTPL